MFYSPTIVLVAVCSVSREGGRTGRHEAPNTSDKPENNTRNPHKVFHARFGWYISYTDL